MPDAALYRDLQRLREDYRRKLRGKLDDLDALVRRARQSGQLGAARQLAHTLKGTSGSYGLREISAALGHVEECLERLHGGGAPHPPQVWGQIERALGEAREQLRGRSARPR